jgi:transcriptional regulator of heat shock response
MKTLKQFKKSIGIPLKERKSVEEVIRAKEPLTEDVVDQLRSVVKKKREADIKFKSGTSVPIDPESAKVILKTYDSLNSTNKKKMQDNMNKDTKSFLKILDFAFSNAK